MKMYLISDNTDTLTGMRLAGVSGIVIHEREELLRHWKMSLQTRPLASYFYRKAGVGIS